MKRIKYTTLTLFGLMSVCILQLIWLNITYNMERNEISKKITDVLEKSMYQEMSYRLNKVPRDMIIRATMPDAPTESNVTCVDDDIYKKIHLDVSLQKLDSIFFHKLKRIDIHTKFTIYKVNKNDKIVDSSKKISLSSFGIIKSNPIPIRLNDSLKIRVAIINPYNIIFQRLGLIILASILITIIIIICIVQQIRIIIKQDNIAKIRKDFSYAMVHDMKSPLTSIMMGISNLESGKLDDMPEKKKKYFAIMGDETKHLLALINKVLTISKIEENKLTLNKTIVTLSPMIHDLAEKFSAKSKKPLTFSYNLQADTALADEGYLNEAISNLIDNAIKYSKDSIKINICSEEDYKYTMITVHDNGIGISGKDMKTIFDKFERASAVNRTMKGGASGFGLGLNYVMQVMKAHGGKVTVNSKKGEYSEFTLYIPRLN